MRSNAMFSVINIFRTFWLLSSVQMIRDQLCNQYVVSNLSYYPNILLRILCFFFINLVTSHLDYMTLYVLNQYVLSFDLLRPFLGPQPPQCMVPGIHDLHTPAITFDVPFNHVSWSQSRNALQNGHKIWSRTFSAFFLIKLRVLVRFD